MDLFKLFRRKDIDREIKVFRSTPDAVLLDVRSEEEFANGHIPGSINIPVDSVPNVEKAVRDHDTPIFIYCLRGTRSLRAAGILRRMGYVNARSIGGIASYKGKLEK